MNDKLFGTRAMAKMAMCVAMISIGGYIAFPTPFSPVLVTATTLALGVTALILPPRQTAVVILAWILLGAAGVPVFSGGQGGIGKLLGPSGGFFPGFLLGYVGASFLKGKSCDWKRYLLALIGAAFPLTYIFGIAYLMFVLGIEMWQAMTMAMFSFIPGDLIKAAAAALIGARLNRVLPR
ncbi:MAG: biotin transporter BioY [Anaerovibrio sp.]|nr:biotin transporter BioY [Anaerovibrio sp.]